MLKSIFVQIVVLKNLCIEFVLIVDGIKENKY